MHLDVSLVILSGAGVYYLVKYNKILATITFSVLILTAVYSAFTNSSQVEPLIDEDELNCISVIQTFDEDAYAMSTHRVYSPWVIGYSGKKTIAPGLFEYDKWNFKQWKKFWFLIDDKETAKML
ncbi:MAG TPA: hypothetical protein EYP30_03470, partial [Archaeoglobaceae archaeon]|nr:hypothetical protein [Archaeoglobaceae archaeon]